MDEELAKLNSRIQATATPTTSAVTGSPPPRKHLSAVARPVATLNLAEHSAAQRSASEATCPPILVMPHGMLQQQSGSKEGSQRMFKVAPSSAVQLVKLSGTVRFGLYT